MRRILLLVVFALLAAAPAASAKVRPGSPGDAFYTPPSKLPGARHGAPIWARDATRRLRGWPRR